MRVEVVGLDQKGQVQVIKREFELRDGSNKRDAGEAANAKVANEMWLAGLKFKQASARATCPCGYIVFSELRFEDRSVEARCLSAYERGEEAERTRFGDDLAVALLRAVPSDLDLDDACEVLQDFIHRIQALEESDFYRDFMARGVTFSMGPDEGANVQEFKLDGPSVLSMKAFLLDFRLLKQDNEAISIRRVAELVERLPVSERLKASFLNSRTALNELLDADEGFAPLGKLVTRRELLDVVLYGELAHLSKKELYRRWVEQPVMEVVVRQKFMVVIAQCCKSLSYMAAVASEMLKTLESRDTPGAGAR